MRKAGMYSGVLHGGLSGKLGPSSLPLARIKKIMKRSSGVAGGDVKMISGEAPLLFSKACELFIEELTRTSWMVAAQGRRRTLHRDDVATAVVATDLFDFLIDLVSSSGHVAAASGEGDGGSDLVERDDDFMLKHGGEGH